MASNLHQAGSGDCQDLRRNLWWWSWEASAISPSHALDWPIQPTSLALNKPLRIITNGVNNYNAHSEQPGDIHLIKAELLDTGAEPRVTEASSKR